MTDMRATADDVRHAYRLLLGREPDEAGFEHHVAYIAANDIAPVDIANRFMRSDEFKAMGSAYAATQEVQLNGVKLYPWCGDRLIGDQLAASGEYEPHVLPLFLDAIKPGDYVLDVGANIGIYSLLAAQKTGDDGRVFSIEPVARNVQSLCAGVIGNDFRNVSVLPVAASDRASVIGVLRHMDSSNGIVDANASGPGVAEYVPTQRLDVLLAAIERLDIVKIDIEGHEPVAWPGLKALVSKHRPIIFSEFNPVAIRNHSRVAPESYLDALFEFANGGIDVLHLDGARARCASSADVMKEWSGANERFGPGGTSHVDLVVDTRV